MATVLSSFSEYPHRLRFQDQEAGEAVVLLLRQHPVTNAGWMFGLIFLTLSPMAVFFSFPYLGLEVEKLIPAIFIPVSVLVFYLCLLAFGFLSFLHWFFNVYIVTDRRILDLDYRGFLFFSVSETPLANIQDVSYKVSGGWGVFFDFGDVFIQTAATQAQFEFLNVPHPHLVHDKITDLMPREGKKIFSKGGGN